MQTALFIGRFQPLHLGHITILQRLAKKYKLLIAIGSSQEARTPKNPFTFRERARMLRAACTLLGIKARIIALSDHPDDEHWLDHLITYQFDIAFSGNKRTLRLLRERGCSVHQIKEVGGVSASHMRRLMHEGKPWQQYVHYSTARMMEGMKRN